LIGTATTGGGSLVYSDEDSDGLYETATIQVATTLTNINEIKAYHSGHNGEQAWEIREPRRKYISGGYAVFIFDSWLLIDPTLFEFIPTLEGATAIDISDTSNFVTAIDIYREYNDATVSTASFQWDNEQVGCATCGGAGCTACGYVSQDGCLMITDGDYGIVTPVPASYDSDNGSWTGYSYWEGGREPDRVRLKYRAGLQSQEYLNGSINNPLPYNIAQAIAQITVARLERPFCSCDNVAAVVDLLREDVTRNERDRSYFTPQELLHNPFGTRKGELEAWRRIHNTVPKRMKGSVI
jgi:hypothetical protein